MFGSQPSFGQPSTRFTVTEKDLLVLHLLRSPRVVSIASNKLKPEHFNCPLEEPYRVLWAINQEYYVLYGVLVPYSVLLSELSKRFELDPNLTQFSDSIISLVDWVYNTCKDADIAEDYCINQLLQPFLDERIIQPIVHTFSGDTKEFYNVFHQAFSNSRLTSATQTNVFDLEDPSLDEDSTPATATGCLVFDKLMDGGARPAHMTGLLAPFGGGKTTFGIDVCVNLAKQRKHAVIFGYEESVKKALRYRVWSCVTGLPIKVFSETKFKDLPAQLKQQLKDYAYIDDYLILMDMSTGTQGLGGIDEVDNVLSELLNKNKKPTAVVIDWLGTMVKRYCAGNGISMESGLYAAYNETLTKARYNVASKYNTELILLHQFNAEAGKRSAGSRASMYDAADFKSFAALVNTCVLINKADSNGIANIFMDKNRGAYTDMFVRVRNPVCRMELIDRQFQAVQDSNGRTTFVDAGNFDDGANANGWT